MIDLDQLKDDFLLTNNDYSYLLFGNCMEMNTSL